MTDATTAQAERMIGKARTALLLDHPFFGLVVLRRPIVLTYQVPTAGADYEGTLYFNPNFVVKLHHLQVIFLLAHEAMHVVLLHWLRKGDRLSEPWNIAADWVINDMLIAEKVGQPIPGGAYKQGARAKSVEELYDPNVQGGNGGIGNDIIGRQPTAAEASAIAAELQQELQQAAMAAESRGKLPLDMQRIVKEITAVETPWFEILERYMVNIAHNDYSWSRPNRRYIGHDLYLPSMRSVGTMGPMVFVTDTSGSIGEADLKHAGGHVDRILEQAVPEVLYDVYCDARVNKVRELLPEDRPFELLYVGGGGTSFKPPFKWVEDNDVQPDVLVYFTDLDGDFPDRAPDYPVIWLATKDRPVPWGEVIRYKRK
jgi:predicted metal-dependent peptidase